MKARRPIAWWILWQFLLHVSDGSSRRESSIVSLRLPSTRGARPTHHERHGNYKIPRVRAPAPPPISNSATANRGYHKGTDDDNFMNDFVREQQIPLLVIGFVILIAFGICVWRRCIYDSKIGGLCCSKMCELCGDLCRLLNRCGARTKEGYSIVSNEEVKCHVGRCSP